MKSNQKLYLGVGIAALLVVVILLLMKFGGGASAPEIDRASSAPSAPEPLLTKEVAAAPVAPEAPVAPMEVSKTSGEKGGWRITGSVTDRDSGTPIAGAEVALFFNQPGRAAEAHSRTKTNSTGDYEFALEQPLAAWVQGSVTATAPGMASGRLSLFDNFPGESWNAKRDFALGPGFTLAGIVVDGADKPLPESEVGLLLRSSPLDPMDRLTNPYEVFPSVLTDAEGRFVLEGVPADRPTRLYTTKRLYKPLFSGPYEVSSRELRLVLNPGQAAVEGYVQNAEGENMSNVLVRAVSMGDGPGGGGFGGRGGRAAMIGLGSRFPDAGMHFTRTDKAGFFEFTGLGIGNYSFQADNGTPMAQTTSQSMLIIEGDKRFLNLRFRPMTTLKGIVMDAANGAPVAGVRIARPGGPAPKGKGVGAGGREVLTGADGRFSVETTVQERFDFAMVPPVFYLLPDSWGLDAEDWREQRVTAQALIAGEELEIRVERRILLEGQVLMPDEVTPAAGVGIDIFPMNQFPPRRMAANPAEAQVLTGPDGKYRVGVSPRTQVAVLARGNKMQGYTTTQVPAASPATAPTIMLRETVSLSGKVTGPAGEPLPGIEVTNFQMTQLANPMADNRAYTDADGRYMFDGLMPDRVRVSVTIPPGSEYVTPQAKNLTMEAGAAPDNVDFQLVKGVEFKGFVLDDQAAAVKGATVRASRLTGAGGRGQEGGGRFGGGGGPGGGGTQESAETGTDGSFTLLLPPDAEDFTLDVSHPAYDPKSAEGIYLDDAPLTITLEGRGKVLLTAWKSGGEQLTTFDYQITIERDSSARGKRTNIEGTVFDQTAPVEEVLSPGTYRVNVYQIDENRKRTGLYGFETVSITESSSRVPIRVEMGDPLKIEGIVVDREGTALSEVTVTLIMEDEAGRGGWQGGGGRGGPQGGGNAREMRQITGKDGKFIFEFTRPGAIRLTGRKADWVQLGDARLTVVPDEEPLPVTITMVPEAGVFGVVLARDGSPLRNVRIHIDRIRGEGARPDEVGKYEIENLEPGRVEVILATPQGAEIERKEARVRAGQREEVNFSLDDRVYISGGVIRNGEAVRGGLRLTLEPQGTEGKNASLVIQNSSYRQYVYPGVYNVVMSGNGGSIATGVVLEIPESPFEQEHNIVLELISVGIVIVVDGIFEQGNLRYSHRRDGQNPVARNTQARRSLFYLDNELPGEIMGEFRDRSGKVYRSDWTPVGVDQENIVTLLEVEGGNDPADNP